MSHPDRLADLLKSGSHREALAELQLLGSEISDEEREVIRAELLECVGDLKESGKLVLSLFDSRSLSPRLRVRCSILLGLLQLEAGDDELAVVTLSEASRAATAEKNLADVCWAKLRLVVALAERSSAESLSGVVADLRREVLRLGDPIVTIALHLFLAEINSRRGALLTAQRHVRVADSLLETFGNHWLAGLSEVNKLCLAYLHADSAAARIHADTALRHARRSGHTGTELAVISNLGHIDLAEGDFRGAERSLKKALTISPGAGRARVSTLDGLAQLELAKGQLEKAERILDEADRAPGGALSYGKLWASLTRVQLLLARGLAGEADVLCGRLLMLAEEAGDASLLLLLRLLRVECGVLLGLTDRAALDLLTTARAEEPSLEVLAETQRVIGRALVHEGDPVGAVTALQRSARVLHGIGRLRREGEIRQLIAAQPAGSAPRVTPLTGRAAADAGAGDRQPSAVSAALAAAATATSRPDLLLMRAASAIEQASRPDLVGLELVDLLAESGCAVAAALVAVGAGGRRRSLLAHGWSDADACAALDSTEAPPMALGTWRTDEHFVVARLGPALADRVAYLAVHRIACASLALAAARREARERSALWPIENPDDVNAGMVLGEQMTELLRVARKVASTDATVLITGESGSGKDVLARTIHAASSRASKPFVPFNCAAVPKDMLETQLFGHRRGAFTGAEEAFQGVIRGAAGGTLFLDEIGEVGVEVQPKLLRFLDTGEIHPLGEAHPIKVDVRIVAATNQDLHHLMRAGRFREDLYYRLCVVPLYVPPLRERREEIPQLVANFLERFSRDARKGRLRVSQEALEYLVLYDWPGNVRQLAGELRRLAAVAETDAVLMPEHLDAPILASRRTRPASERELSASEVVVRIDQPLPAVIEYVERVMIQHAWKACDGKVDDVAQMLGLSRKGLYLKRQRLGIEPAH